MIGRTTRPADELVQERFDKGWARLEVTDVETGEQVGGIDLHPDTGNRTWWSECDHGHRVTWERDDDGRTRWYADCPCGAESGPFDSPADARAATLDHRAG
jgi:hypothetical protein